MRVVHIYKSYYPETLGGVERCIDNLAKAVVKRGVESSVIVTSGAKGYRQRQVDSYPVYYFPAMFSAASCPISLSLWRQFKRLVADYDIIHYHFPWPFADLLHLSHRIRKPTLVTYHSDIVKQRLIKPFYQPLMNQFLRRANHIVATSQNYYDTSRILQHYRNKCHVIPIGIEAQNYPVADEYCLAQWRQRVGENFFLFVGVLRYYKGLSFLLQALRGSNLPVVIVGAGPQARMLQKQATALQLSSVHFTGYLAEIDKMALYQLCRAVIMPAHLRSEAFCITLAEGLMTANPLISTEIGTGTSFINRHNETGLVVPPQNPQLLRQAMERLRDDEELYQQFKQCAYQRFEHYFTAEKMATRYMELYQQILSERA